MDLKNKVHSECVQNLNQKIRTLQQELLDLKNDAENDAKSSAGDKHETARAMMHIESDRINKQLIDLLNQKSVLDHLPPKTSSSQITTGSLIKTELEYFYLAVPIGRIVTSEVSVVVLSPQSPLGSLLLGAKVGDTKVLNKIQHKIVQVY